MNRAYHVHMVPMAPVADRALSPTPRYYKADRRTWTAVIGRLTLGS
jgi:hypothetical protein